LAALADGRLELFTKGRSGQVFRFEIGPEAWLGSELDLAAADTLPLRPTILRGRWVTGAAADLDGVHVLIRTYTAVYRLLPGERWTVAGPPCWIGLIEPQGEAIDVLEVGQIVLGSEGLRGRPGGLTLVRCRWD